MVADGDVLPEWEEAAIQNCLLQFPYRPWHENSAMPVQWYDADTMVMATCWTCLGGVKVDCRECYPYRAEWAAARVNPRLAPLVLREATKGEHLQIADAIADEGLDLLALWWRKTAGG